MLNYMDVFWFSASKYCQLSYSTSTSSTFNDFISGAPSSGWANVILEDQNNTRLGSTEIFYFPDEEEADFMIQNPSQFKNFSEEVAYHTASSFDSSDGDPQRYGPFGKFLSLFDKIPSANIYFIVARQRTYKVLLLACAANYTAGTSMS